MKDEYALVLKSSVNRIFSKEEMEEQVLDHCIKETTCY